MIKTEQLHKTYGKKATAVHAITDVNLTIEDKETVSIVGPSGSGKSTLLHLLSGLDQPTKGRIFYRNKDIGRMNNTELVRFRRRYIGFVFQFFNLVPTLTIEENIMLPILMDGKNPDKAYIKELTTLLGIENKAKTFPTKLSGGQQQRVAIARALSTKPKIVFADEPTGNLDSKTGKQILDLLLDTQRLLGQILVLVTHDPAIAEQCQRTIEMKDGEIIADCRRNLCYEN